MNQTKKNKLNMSAKLLIFTVIPLLILAVVVTVVTSEVIGNIMRDRTEMDMESQAMLVSKMYDELYPGDFSVETYLDSYYTVLKGGYDVSASLRMLDNIRSAYGDEVTIFRGATSVLTTLMDDNGERLNLINVSPVVEHEVYETGDSKFYADVLLNGDSYFAYFTPIVNSNNEIFGMIGVYRLSSDINDRIRAAQFPLVAVFLIAILFIGFINFKYSGRIVSRIKGIQKFVRRITDGKFDEDIPEKYLREGDELSDLAHSASIMRRELSLLVEYDALTELYNRRYAVNKLRSMSEEGEKNYCMCIGDIDFFKKVNDTYGHDAGDEVLKAVSKKLKEHMTGKGFVARWGGEEFLIVFLNMSLRDSANALLEALEDIRALEITSGVNIIKVTMSFGITEAVARAGYDELIKEADERLYYSKTHGRNQITAVHVTEENNALDALDRR